jgi:lipopolysaccharide export system protein LptA
MLTRPYSRAVVVLALAAGLLMPAQAPLAQQKKLKGPTVITSERLMADNRAGTAVFEGSVVAKNNGMTLYSDKMEVFYAKGGDVEKIVAYGRVKLVRAERVVTSEHAEFYASEQKVIFTENPRAVEGGNVVTGTKMTYLIEEDRSLVENSRVFIEGRGEGKTEGADGGGGQ